MLYNIATFIPLTALKHVHERHVKGLLLFMEQKCGLVFEPDNLDTMHTRAVRCVESVHFPDHTSLYIYKKKKNAYS